MERHCKKCGHFATDVSGGDDATCPRCGASYARLEGHAARESVGSAGPSSIGAHAGARNAASTAPEDSQWARMRRAAPGNVALPRTLEWSQQLPAEVRPRELLRSFGRIANRLAADWAETAPTYAYFDQLLVDRRGNRRGFPPQVKAELEALRRSYVVNRPAPGVTVSTRSGAWGDVRKR
jgi:hypothetical protein